MDQDAIIQVSCQHCQKQIRTKAGLAGRRIRCAHCNQPFVVAVPTNPSGHIASGDARMPQRNPSVQRQPANRAPQDRPIKATCPDCNRNYTFGSERAGRKARCKDCGAVFAIKARQRRRQRERTHSDGYNSDRDRYDDLPPLNGNNTTKWIIVGVSIALVLMLIPVVWLVLESNSEPVGIPEIQIAKADKAAPIADQAKQKKVEIPGPDGIDGPAIDKKAKQNPKVKKPAPIDLTKGMSTGEIETILKQLGYKISNWASTVRSNAVDGSVSFQKIGRDCTKPGAAQPIRYEVSHYRYASGKKSANFTLSTKRTADGETQLRAVTAAINPTCTDTFNETIKEFEFKNKRTSRTLGKLTVNVDSKKIELYCYLPGGAPAGPPIAKKKPKNNEVNPQPPNPGAKAPSVLILGEWVSTETVPNPNGGKDLTAGFLFAKDGKLQIVVGGNAVPLIKAQYRFTGDKSFVMTIDVPGARQPPKNLTVTILSISDREMVLKSEEERKTTSFVRPGGAAVAPPARPQPNGTAAAKLRTGTYRLKWKVYKIFLGPQRILTDTGRDDEVVIFQRNGETLMKIAGDKFFGGKTSRITVAKGKVQFTGDYSNDTELVFQGKRQGDRVTGAMTGKIRDQNGKLNDPTPWTFTLSPVKLDPQIGDGED